MEVFIGKQPILNQFEEVVAYELLYRNKNLNAFPNVDEDEATIEVVSNAFLSFGLKNLSENKPVFINFSEKLLLNDFILQLDPNHVVIEVLESVNFTPTIIARLKELKSLGFRIALDDFQYDPENPALNEVFNFIDIIKIDFLNLQPSIRLVFERHMRVFYPHITLLAEKVETREQYEVAKNSGYRLFQGYFFEHPQTISSKDIEPNSVQYFHIISLLRSDEPDIDEIAETIEQDVSLTYKLLMLVNISNTRLKSKITSIRQAIMILGLIELQKWIFLLAVRANKSNQINNELIFISLFRSKVCEMLARQKGHRNHSEYYLAGMFSNIDAILKVPLEKIVQELPFSEVVIKTILGEDTEMTPYLNLAKAIQKLDWDTIVILASELEINIETIDILYYSTNEWVEEILHADAELDE